MDQPDVLTWRDGHIEALDQTALPHQVRVLRITTVDQLVDAITRLAIRGAPVLGAAGALGVALATRQAGREGWDGPRLDAEIKRIADARPTAVNLRREVAAVAAHLPQGDRAVEAAALAVAEFAATASYQISRRGAAYLRAACGREPLRIHTHCNTGRLACLGWGTALGVIRALHADGALRHVIVDETRPLLQGARLTCWELGQLGIEHRLACDGAGPFLISQGLADAVVVGADRVAANGDVANKVGTFGLALAAHRAGIPFLVAVPESTIDEATPTGAAIPIELRADEEITVPAAPAGTKALNYAFDVTPAELVSAVVTEKRLIPNGQPLTRPALPGAFRGLPGGGGFVRVGRPQRVQERLGGLRPGDAVLAVDDEERHAGRAQLAGLVDVLADRVGVLVAVQDGTHPVRVGADLAEQGDQGVRVGQVGALGEVRAQQPFLGRVAEAEIGGQVQQAVRVQGVHGERGAEVEVEALLAGQLGDPARHLVRLRAEPPGQVIPGGHRRARRGVGVQLETAPGDLHLAGVLELAQRALQPALADVAPRADHIGPDLDLH